MSISKWFGGAGSDSSDEDNDAGMRSGASTAEGEDTPIFSVSSPPGESALVVDDELSGSEVDEIDGVIPIPGGEPATLAETDAGATGGEGLRPVASGGAAAAQYSPPQQDKE